jgi:type II secretory pathway pseudopilin PulG
MVEVMAARRPPTLRRPPGAEAGTSLLEVVLTTALLSVVLAGAFGAMNTFTSTTKGADLRLENLTEARFIMDTLSKDIRTATRPASDPYTGSPFTVAGPRSLSFYANLRTTTGPKLVTVDVDPGGVLRERVVEPAGTHPDFTYGTEPAVRLVGSYVLDDGIPLFRYTDAAGEEVAGSLPGGMLGEAERKAVTSVHVTLRVRKTSELSVAPTTVQTTVRLPNVTYDPMRSK